MTAGKNPFQLPSTCIHPQEAVPRVPVIPLHFRGSAEREWRLTEEEQKVGQRILTAPALHRGRPQYNRWVFTLENTLVAFSEYKDTYKKLFSLGQMLVVSDFA